jgi:protein-S-isoprenylcysteine O-methyltransferase Ste14
LQLEVLSVTAAAEHPSRQGSPQLKLNLGRVYRFSSDLTRVVVRMRILRIILGVIFFPAALLLPAGRVDWPEAWAFLIMFFAAGALLRVFVARHKPGLLKERLSRAPDVEKWDTIMIGIFYPGFLLATLVVSALDSGRFGWSSMPMVGRVSGWIGLGIALAIVWWVMSVNPFASRWARIQEDRGHEVITVGPYRYMRHPMYVAVIIFLICVPAVLGSWWGLLPGAATAILFIFRTALEDKMLLVKLPGYQDYARRVRYRLLPGIW